MYDFIIIGSGAGGATAFKEISKKHTVLMVEEGQKFNSTDTSVSTIMKRFYRDGGVRPAIGFPSVAIGEGACLGGSTEINGGLFWRTPKHVLDEWRNMNIEFAIHPHLDAIFQELEESLNVVSESILPGFDRDSELLVKVCRQKNLLVVPARRMLKQCKKSNLCPSGCPANAKQTMSRTFIPEGIDNGGEILSGWKATKILSENDSIKVILSDSAGLIRTIESKKIIISCGAIESRRLLAKSNMLSKSLGSIGFHANFKMIARFEQKIEAQKGTIFTHQMQEYMSEGFLLMPANFNQLFLAYGSSSLTPAQYNKISSSMDFHAMYTGQYRVEGRILDIPLGFGKYFLVCYFTKKDRVLLREFLKRTAELLFLADASEVYLPFMGSKSAVNIETAFEMIERTPFHKLVLSTVHLMSSIPVTPHSVEISEAGFLKKNPLIRVLDASILPTTVGESPQGTIMALTRYLLGRI
jgi:hypothetical protein